MRTPNGFSLLTSAVVILLRIVGVLLFYLTSVGIIGLLMEMVGSPAGSLTMRVASFGVTSDNVFGFIVCSIVTLLLGLTTWLFLAWIPSKLLSK